MNIRFAWAISLKNKTAESLRNIFEAFLSKVTMKSLSFDAETEFNNNKGLSLLDEH